MRISTGQIFANANKNMMENQSSLLDVQNKLSSGKQFTSLAEDPVGASQVVSLNRELAQLDMFNSNIDASRRRLELEETTLDDLNTASDRVRELVVQAANGTLSDADRQAVSYELEELVGYMAGLMNTRDAKGEYLFSGSQGQTQTYVEKGGRYEYQGDATSRQIQVSSALYVRSTDNGQFLFESVTDDPTLKATGDLRTSFDPEKLTVTDPDAFAAFMRETGDIAVEVDQYDDGLGNPDSVTYNYTLRDSAGNVVEYPQGTPLQALGYDGTAAPTIQLDGASFELDLPVPVTGSPGVTTDDLSATEEPTLNILDDNAYTGLMRQAGGEVSIRSVDTGGGVYEYRAYGADGLELNDGAMPTPNPLLSVTPPVAPAVEPTLTLSDAQGTPALEFQRDAVADDTSADVTLAFEAPADLKLSFSQPPSNILNTIMDTVEMMREPVGGVENALARVELQERFALTLDQINMSQERLSQATATLGSRLNTLNDAELTNTDFQLMTEGTLSAVQDLDYAAASTELAKRQLALEAAYASFAKIQNLSLFNYIQ
ncbi:flagellar hook-associated protein FlgL [Marinobacterium litorale]|uniref:flagellar hook-associated protein FlgL n=1 Tax=Marinobacterium litorale TaxID=404770 RepID=UPI000426A3C9|nr:flagellar hook-associated protein FlgL [Marinobacterium litorale]